MIPLEVHKNIVHGVARQWEWMVVDGVFASAVLDDQVVCDITAVQRADHLPQTPHVARCTLHVAHGTREMRRTECSKAGSGTN
jgi:hypothetical protein